MPKKKTKAAEAAVQTAKDKKTLGSIRGLAEGVVKAAESGRAPHVEIPSRSLSNVRFNQSKRIIEQGKTTSIRGLFYLLKHTIEGTNEETFDTQDECDPVIEDVEVSLDSMR